MSEKIAVVLHCYGFVTSKRLDNILYMSYLEEFEKWLRDNYQQIAFLIIAGGARDGDESSEAHSVERYLLERYPYLFQPDYFGTGRIILDDLSLSTPAIIRKSKEMILDFSPEINQVTHICDNWRKFKVRYILDREYQNRLEYQIVALYRKDVTYKSSYWFQFLQTLFYLIFPRTYQRDLYKEFKKPPN